MFEGLHVTWRVINSALCQNMNDLVCLFRGVYGCCLFVSCNVHAYSQRVCVINYDTRHTIHVCYQCLQILNVSIIRRKILSKLVCRVNSILYRRKTSWKL